MNKVTYGDKLLVLGILAVTGENGTESLLSVEGLQDLVQSLDKSYSREDNRVSIMPSIPVQIRALAHSWSQAPVPTVIRLRLLDHTLDGIIDVVGLGLFFDLNLGHLLLATVRDKCEVREMNDCCVDGKREACWVQRTEIIFQYTYLSSLSDIFF